MGALLSSYRRGSRYAMDSFVWLLGSRGTAALRLGRHTSSHSSKNVANAPWLEEEFVCPCYYTENFYIRKVRGRPPAGPLSYNRA